MKRLVLTLCLIACASVHADTRKKVGLVLSGGGARGLAHIGVLRALDEHHVRIDAITGTSMGAIVGALYASGKIPDEIEAIVMAIDWPRLLSDEPARDRLAFRRKQDSMRNVIPAQATISNGIFTLPKGVVLGQNLQLSLQQQFPHGSEFASFDQLPIPFRAVAGDLVTGEPYVFHKGSLATAIRASVSIPGLFAPVEIDGKMLVDGGIANNLPVDVVKTMGVDYIIAVDIATPLYQADQLDSIVPIIEQLTTLLTFSRLRSQYALLRKDDLLVTPDLSDVKTLDFNKIALSISRGYDAMNAAMEGHTELEADASPRQTANYSPPVIDQLTIVNKTRVSDQLILSQLHQQTGAPLDEAQLQLDIESIYGYDYFEFVNYEIASTDAGNALIVTATDARGHDQLGASVSVSSDSRTASHFNVGAIFSKALITQRGGEWIIAAQLGKDPWLRSELYLPFDFRQRLFANPYARYSENRYNLTTPGGLSEFRVDRLTLGLLFGSHIANKALLGFGLEHQKGEIHDNPNTLFAEHSQYALFDWDSLDNLGFPRTGTLARLRLERVEPGGSTPDYDLLRLSIAHAWPFGNNALTVDGRYQTGSNGIIDRHRQQRLGGLKNLTGLHRDALTGSELRYGSVMLTHRLRESGILPVDMPIYLGLMFEAGNAWIKSGNDDNDLMLSAGLFLGVDTPIGPLYVGYGRTDSDQSSWHLQLGHLFQDTR